MRKKGKQKYLFFASNHGTMSGCFLGSRASLQKAWVIPPRLCRPLFLGILSLDLPLPWSVTLWTDGTLKPLCRQLLKKATAALAASAISFGLWYWCPQRSAFVEKKYTRDFTAAGVRQGNCRMDFLWFVNLFFTKYFPSLWHHGWRIRKKKKEGKKPQPSQLYIYPQTTKFRHESILVRFNAHRKAIVEQNYSLVLLL